MVLSIAVPISRPVAPRTDVERAVERILPSLVKVQVADGTGSGWAWAPDLIVTNYHVIVLGRTNQPAPGIMVQLPDDRNVVVEFVGGDPASDVAVLRLPKGESLVPIPVINYTPRLGQKMIVAGYPAGLGPQVAAGIFAQEMPGRYLTDTDITPGNSGGPMVDTRGEFVGMISSMFIPPRGEGWSSAVPAPVVREAVERILRDH